MTARPHPSELEPPEFRRELRRIARTHHPDVGGDLDVYLRLVAEAGAARGTVLRPSGPRRLRRLVRTAHRGLRTTRTRLPRAVPGARRYIDI